MASSTIQTSLVENSPSFFAIVLEGTLNKKSLLISGEIVKQCGSSLTDDVFLKLPCGSQWKLGLTRTNEGKVYLDKGWVDFSKHYSIGIGHMLVFRYEGDSLFNVNIYGKNTREIHYPLKMKVKEEEEEITISSDDDTCDLRANGNDCPDELLLLRSESRKKKEEDNLNGRTRDLVAKETRNSQPSRVLASSKGKRKGKRALSDRDGDRQFEPPLLRSESRKRKGKGRLNDDTCTKCIVFTSSTKMRNGKKVLSDDDDLFEPRLPRSRTCKRPGKYVRNGDTCDDRAKRKRVKIESDDDSSDVNYSPEPPSRCSRPRQRKRKGKRAVKDDACLPINWEESARTLKRVGKFKSEHPFFWIVIGASHLGYSVTVPCEFARTYLCVTTRVVLKVPGEKKKWLVNFKFNFETVNSRPRFMGGWSAFARENGLEKGDVCVFAMTKSVKKVYFEVTFFRKNRVTDSATKRKSLASDEQSENPSFAIYMHRSYLKKVCRLRIPAVFARTYLKKNRSEILVRDAYGSSWSFKYKISQETSMKKIHAQTRHEFLNGWNKFREESNLREGDICIFELITNKKGISFQVRIVEPTHEEYEQIHLALGPKRTKPLRRRK